MKILLITGFYPPEIGGAAHLFRDLAVNFKQMGHEITVVASFPSYNLKEIPDHYRRGWRMKEKIDDIVIERIRLPLLPRTNKLLRGLEHFICGLFLSGVTLFLPRADVALVVSPPLPLPWLIEVIGKLRRFPVILNVQDLFPREAIELGMLNNRILIKIFEEMERQVYCRASAVTVHSPGNRQHVVTRGALEDRVHVVYNWVDTDLIHPDSKTNTFSQKYNLDNKFIVSYAGTMGWAQDMGTIIDCANQLRDHPNIYFVLVGDGVEKEKSLEKSKKLGLANILWLPIQPLAVYPDILASSDISLINLHPELRTPVVPSKLLSIMSAGRAVVASLPKESDARQIIADSRCGICVDAGHGIYLADAILKLESDRKLLREMGKRGRDYVETHFSRQICAKKMETILENAIHNTR